MSEPSAAASRARARARARVLRSLSNRLIAACVFVAGVLVVCALAVWGLERDRNPNVTGPVSGFSYVTRALLEGSTPWPPTRPATRVVHEVVMVLGRSVVALATGALASRLVELVIRKGSGMDSVTTSGHVVICGWSSKGHEILRELHAKEVEDDTPVVILASLPANPSRDPLTTFVAGSPTNAEDLVRAGIERASTAILLADETATNDTADDVDARTLLTALAVESLNPTCYTCVEVVRSANRPHFERTRADELIVSAELTGALLAGAAKTRGLSRFVADLVTHPEGAEFYAVDVPATLVGVRFDQAVERLKRDHDVLAVAVAPSAAAYEINPPGERIVGEGERLLVIANTPPKLGVAAR